MILQEKIEVILKAAKNGGLDYYSNMKQLMHFICSNFILTEEFIREYQDELYWKDVCTEQQLTNSNLLRQFADKIDWFYVRGCGRTILTEEQKKEFFDYFPDEWKK